MTSELAKASLPASIMVGPFNYTVSFDDQGAYDHQYLGLCLFRSKCIHLCPRQSDTELPQTLLHELLHALGQAYEIPEWNRHKTSEDGNVTDKIDMMATALLMLIRDNPDLVNWLQEDR